MSASVAYLESFLVGHEDTLLILFRVFLGCHIMIVFLCSGWSYFEHRLWNGAGGQRHTATAGRV